MHIIDIEEVKNAMSTLTSYQTILDSSDKPAFAVVPSADFVKLPCVVRPGMIPNDVAGKRIMDGVSMLQAWREYLMLTQEEMAKRMGIILEQLAYELWPKGLLIMKESDIEALSIVQKVLHSILLTLAAGSKADLGDIGSALEATAANGTINPMAGQMLTDLASGATGLHAAGIRKQ